MDVSSKEFFYAHISEDATRRQTVKAHLQGTAQLAEQFACPFGGQSAARLAGLLHDVGKYSAAFQARLLQNGPKVDHSTAGAKVAYTADGLAGLPVAFAVAGHHAGLADGGNFKLDTAQAATLAGRLRRDPPPCEAWRQELTLPGAQLPDYCRRDAFSLAFYTRMLYSCLVDADYLDTEAFMAGEAPPRGRADSLQTLRKRMRAKADAWLAVGHTEPLGQKRNAVLRACLDHGAAWGPGLYTLTVPTGGGKTFDSLAFALEHALQNGMERVIYVIPYTSIIDQTVTVFGEILGPENVLAHHAGADYLLKEEGELSPADYRKALAAENWDAPVVVTTAVQFFESLYANRSSRCRKLHNIANSVVIFDEAQTLPVPYLRPCVAAIAQLVQHYHATAVLCTATQPALQPLFAEFMPGATLPEICPDAASLYTALRRTTLRDLGQLEQQALTDRLAAHPQVLCVVNRRKTAQALYATLPQEGRYCLTTLLCAADRKRLLDEIRARLREGLPCRVVSTSLIEAGVDVDFPAAYREETGLDSILQTAGRCNREGKRPAAESPVYSFTLEGCAPPAMLAQNLDALTATRLSGLPLDEPEAIEYYFIALREIKGSASLDRKFIIDAFQRGRNGALLPFEQVAADFHLIEEATKTIYLPICPEADQLCQRLRHGEHSRSLFRALGAYSVSIYRDHFDALHSIGALALIDKDTAILSDIKQYDTGTGLSLDIDTGHTWFA